MINCPSRAYNYSAMWASAHLLSNAPSTAAHSTVISECRRNTQQQACYSIAVTPRGGGRDYDSRHQHRIQQQRRKFSSRQRPTNAEGGVRLSTLLSKHLGLSRRQSERMILTERVTLFGKIVTSPAFELHPSNDPNQYSTTAMKVDGKLIEGVGETLKVLYLQQNDTPSSKVNGGDVVGKRNSTKSHEYSNTRVWLANKLKGELITEVSFEQTKLNY